MEKLPNGELDKVEVFTQLVNEFVESGEIEASDNLAHATRGLGYEERIRQRRLLRDRVLELKDAGQEPPESLLIAISTVERFAKLVMDTEEMKKVAENKTKIALGTSGAKITLWLLDWGHDGDEVNFYADVNVAGKGSVRGILRQRAIILGQPLSIKSNRRWVTAPIVSMNGISLVEYDD